MYLCKWPDTITSNLLNEFKCITAGLACQIRASSDNQLMRELLELTKLGHRSYMTHKEFSAAAKDVVDEANSERLHKVAQDGTPELWMYSHIMDGFPALTYPYVEGEAVLEYQDVMRIIGITKFMVSRAMVTSNL